MCVYIYIYIIPSITSRLRAICSSDHFRCGGMRQPTGHACWGSGCANTIQVCEQKQVFHLYMFHALVSVKEIHSCEPWPCNPAATSVL